MNLPWIDDTKLPDIWCLEVAYPSADGEWCRYGRALSALAALCEWKKNDEKSAGICLHAKKQN